MKTRRFLSLLMLAGITLFVSCEKDPDPLSKEEAVAKLESVSGEYTDIRGEYEASQGAQVENTMYNLDLPFYSPLKKSPAKEPLEITKSLKGITSKQEFLEKFEDGDFPFNEYTGTWTYNPQNPYLWDHSSTPTDQIIVNFPHPYNNASNNAKLTYYDYTATQTLGGMLMTGLKAKIELNNVQVWTWEFSASYSITNVNMTSTTTVGVFSFINEVDVTSSDETKWSIKVSMTVKKDGSQVFKVYNSATYKILDDQSVEATVEVKITVKSIEFRFKLTFNSMDMYDYQNFDPNDYITMSIWTTSGAKVADLEYVYNVERENWELWIKFTNGETVLAETYLGDLQDEVDIFWDLFEIEEGY